MPGWFGRYFAEVWEIHVEASERWCKAHETGGLMAETKVTILNTPILFFAPTPPLAKAIRWKLLGI